MQQPTTGLGRVVVEFSRSPIFRNTPSVGLLSTSDQLVAEAAAYTTNTRAEHLCPQRDSNPRSQQRVGCWSVP